MKKLLLTLAILGTLQTSFAAIAFDVSTTAQTVNPQPLNFNITGVTSNNTVLICTQTTNGGFTSTGITAGGNAMTQILSGTDSSPTQYLYYRVNPGSGTIAISMGATGSAVAGSCATYTGVDQTTPIEATSSTAFTTTTSYTTTLTTLTDQAWVVATARAASAAALTAGAGTTLRVQVEATFFGGGGLWDSNGGRSVGSNSLNVTSASQQIGRGLMIALKPAGSAAAPVNKGAILKLKSLT